VLERFLALWEDGHSSLRYFPGVQYTAPAVAFRSDSKWLSRIPGEQPPPPRVFVVARDTTDEALRAIQPGSELLAVDQVPIDSFYAAVRERVSGSTLQWRDYVSDQRLLAGPAGTEVELTLRELSGATKVVRVTRPPHPGDAEARRRIAELYRDPATIATWAWLEGDWGYIRLTTFAAESLRIVVDAFDRALDSLYDAPGLVLDLRANGGGYLDAMTEIAGRFLAAETTLGYYQKREHGEDVNFEAWDPAAISDTLRTAIVAKPRDPVYRGPVVVIIDRGCFSACEGFTGALQTLGRILVVGRPSGGGSGVSGLVELPSGAIVSFSWSVFWLPDGRMIEGKGVLPDIYVKRRPRDWASGRDRVLERAVRALEQGEAAPLQAGPKER
jgi:C-terminal processing protease CtpA/Prc